MKRGLQRAWHAVAERPRLQSGIYITLLVLIAIVTHSEWFNPHSILTFGDWQYRPTESIRQMFSSWQTWVPFEGLGSVNILMSGFPFRGLAWSLIANMGFSYDIATKLTLFIPAAIGGFLTAYLLGVRLFKDRFVAFITALFYGSTPYYLSIQAGHLPINIIYLLTPLLVFFLDKALDTNRIRHWVALALGYSVGVFYEVRIMYIVTIILVLYGVGYIWMHKRRMREYMLPVIVFGALVVALNLFWLIPTKLAAGGSIGDVAGRGLFGDSLFSLAQSFTVMKWNWTGAEVNRAFIAQPVQPYMWAVPAVAFSAMLFAKKYSRIVLIFLIITTLGILLTKQSAPPLSSLYGWLYDNFPGFVLFREASKFYLLVAFGYFGLIGYALLGMKDKIWHKHARIRPAVYVLSVTALISVAACNLWPAANGSLAGTFRSATMPADYRIFKDFVQKQSDYFRVYWLPRESWWGYYDNQHPRVRAIDIVEQNWQQFTSLKGGNGYELAHKNVALLQQPFSEQLFSSASVKYVVVPIRDIAGDEDFFPSYGNDRQYYIDQLSKVSFLKRIDIGTSELAVYENEQYRPYISAATSVYLTKNTDMPIEQAGFVAGLGAAFSTDTIDAARQSQLSLGSVATLFDAAGTSIARQDAVLQQQSTVTAGSYLQIGKQAHSYSYALKDTTLALYQDAGGKLLYNGAPIEPGDSSQELGVTAISKGAQYYVAVGDTLAPLELTAGRHRLGNTADAVRIYSSSGVNALTNASFENGNWGALEDCNDYDDNPLISMDVEQGDAPDGNNHLALYAQRHTACVTERNVSVTGGTAYALGIDYRNEDGQQVGYILSFNDPARTVIEQTVSVTGQAWRTYWRRVLVPDGATRMDITLKGYPGVDQNSSAVTYYDNIRFTPLAYVLSRAESAELRQLVPLSTGQAIFTYEDLGVHYANTIPNPSFETGTWQKTVGDCHNYDRNPVIGMSLDNIANDGKKSLRLTASRHIACTGLKDLPVQGNAQYFFSFSFNAQNTKQVRYRFVFNDPAKTAIDTYAPVDHTGRWRTYTTSLRSPLGATAVSLTIYATPNAYGEKEVSVQYDNFRLVETPAIGATYHVVTPPATALKAPARVEYTVNSPTRKTIVIEHATTPFYLVMNEAYDSHWILGGVPTVDHFKINGGLNAWYIDPVKVCAALPDACDKHGSDAYSFHLTAAFSTQRWFSYGLAMSGVVWTGAATYVLCAWYINRPWKGRRL